MLDSGSSRVVVPLSMSRCRASRCITYTAPRELRGDLRRHAQFRTSGDYSSTIETSGYNDLILGRGVSLHHPTEIDTTETIRNAR